MFMDYSGITLNYDDKRYLYFIFECDTTRDLHFHYPSVKHYHMLYQCNKPVRC